MSVDWVPQDRVQWQGIFNNINYNRTLMINQVFFNKKSFNSEPAFKNSLINPRKCLRHK
jgi:hypothetical protein